ncbi:MAG TPA: capsule assembly Wzi family protein [Terracidiphilus sp.]|nr:capsule assembly Wzi family protein [Terracidiphilus sp.]
MSRRLVVSPVIPCATLLAGLLVVTANPLPAQQPGAPPDAGQAGRDAGHPVPVCEPSVLGSPYIPVDSWVYPAVLRLYSLGYVDDVFLGMRPWTRLSVSHMLEQAGARIEDADAGPATEEAQAIYDALMHELRDDIQGPCLTHRGNSRIESTYTVVRGISGTPLRDSYHLGSTIINDYGRPYENGFNNYTGASGYAAAGRFVLYVRGEFEAAPSAAGYSQALAQALSTVDDTTFLNPAGIPYHQDTIPMGPIATATDGRVLEAFVSAHYLNHEISLGKQDVWLGPGQGGAFAYSNNAENIYSFRINRIEPLYVPLLSRLTGPFRHDFLVGGLRGHTYMPNPANPGGSNPNLANVINPGDPWVYVEKISFRPTENLEFGFERTAIWGGEGHAPITINSFLRSFFSVTAGVGSVNKFGRNDPGARFGAFDFSYRLPFVRKWLTLYTDSEVHDDVSPIDAPHRAAYRPGLYLSHVPGMPKLDIRAEAASTDPSHSDNPFRGSYPSLYGHFMYYETIQRQGYTNKGQLFGDWIGREDKGGQAWITYHLSGNEWIQVGVRNQKATKYFIPGSTTQTIPAGSPGCPLSTPCLAPGGTTLNDINFQVVKRIGKDFEVNGSFAYERWKAPIYLPGLQTVTTTTIQLTWFPNRKISF